MIKIRIQRLKVHTTDCCDRNECLQCGFTLGRYQGENQGKKNKRKLNAIEAFNGNSMKNNYH